MRRIASSGAPKSVKPPRASLATRSRTGCQLPNNPRKPGREKSTPMISNRITALWIRALVGVCLCAFLITAAPAQQSPGQPPSTKKSDRDTESFDIVVQGALDSELQPLLAALEEKEQVQIAAWTFWKGRIGSKRVVVSRTEVGPINAVAATTLAIVNFKPKIIINQGTAGASDPELKVFDIVVGDATVDFGAFRSSHADAGQGIDMSRWTPIYHRLRIDGKDRKTFPRFAG